jgi:membrane protein DedA with SNARE-associated domain
MIAAAIWAATFVGAGVLFGRTAVSLLGHWAVTIELTVAAIFLAVLAAVLLRPALRAKRIPRSTRR